jgi:penicillin-insensitive murein endopeptidase
MRTALLYLALCIPLAAADDPVAQDKNGLTSRAFPRISHPDDSKTAAKELFARKPAMTQQEARSIGFYSAGCLAGGTALPISGPAWQVMRLSRNRNWGHPTLIRFLETMMSGCRPTNSCASDCIRSVSSTPTEGPSAR